MAKFKVALVRYDMDKTKKRNRKNLMVNGRSEKDIIDQLERIHKGEKLITIHEIIWDEEQNEVAVNLIEREREAKFYGHIKLFDKKKGFGFITPADEEIDELFFHISATGGEDLRDHDEVEFEIGKGPKGPCAIKIKLIEE